MVCSGRANQQAALNRQTRVPVVLLEDVGIIVFTNGAALHQAIGARAGGLPGDVVLQRTQALCVGSQVVSLELDVINSPFSLVATNDVLRLNGLERIFAEIHQDI